MIQSSRHETDTNIQFKIPWDSNTAKGFFGSIVITIIAIMIFNTIKFSAPKAKIIEHNTIPLTVLNFGSGDGTGLKSGNLTEEGQKARGKAPTMNLEDAKLAAPNTKTSNQTSNTQDLTSNLKPVKDFSSENKVDKTARPGNDAESVGDPKNGDRMGSGLGNRGSGKGLGDGLGDIDWGGGGNRTVLHKPLPKMPNGVKSSAQIVLRFRVLSDGTVSGVVPVQKADPELEKAAIDALKKWRFNPINGDIIMEGTIPMTFILR